MSDKDKEIDKKIEIVDKYYERYTSETETEAYKNHAKMMLQSMFKNVLNEEPGTRNMKAIRIALIKEYEKQRKFKKPAPVS